MKLFKTYNDMLFISLAIISGTYLLVYHVLILDIIYGEPKVVQSLFNLSFLYIILDFINYIKKGEN